MSNYTPKGRMAVWLAAMRKEPDRIWTTAEAVAVMRLERANKLGGYAAHALASGVIYVQKVNRRCYYSLKPFPEQLPPPPQCGRNMKAKPGTVFKQWSPEGDVRIPQVIPGWTPPKMVCVRTGA